MSEQVLSFEAALAAVLREAARVPTGATEWVALAEAGGRVLAEAVVADRDQPPFARSTRDGYAVRAADAGATMRVVGLVRAGEEWVGTALTAGEAVEIMTGAPVPAGADAVVMVEHVRAEGDRLSLVDGRGIAAGQNIVPRGAEAREGAGVLRAGTVVGAAEIAVAASCGRVTLPVVKKPLVAIVATGDELVELPSPGNASDPTHGDKTAMNGAPRPLGSAEIWNSNSYALAEMVRAEGGHPGRLPIARDVRQDVWERIAQGSMWDLLVLSGGVSMGKFDLVEEVLGEFGAEFFFTGALIQPGKPVVFGRIPKRGGTAHPLGQAYDGWTGEWTYFFGLPGNPVSTQVTFALFVAPMLRALAGQREIAPRFVEARLAEDVRGGARVMRFLPAEMSGGWDGVTVRVVGWQGSGDVAANARGNCYAVLPAGVESFRAGETVRVLLR